MFHKLYLHTDKNVDLEFKNAYRQISGAGATGATGAAGPAGAAGAAGANGVSAIQTLHSVITYADLVNRAKTIGTLPVHHIVLDILGIWYSGITDYAFPLTFRLGYTGSTEYYHKTTFTSDPPDLPCRLWPTLNTLTTPAAWIGLYSSLARNVIFSFDTSGTVPTDLVFVVNVNYLLYPELTMYGP